MGRKDELKSLPSLVEMPDGEEILFDHWSLDEKEDYQQRMMKELERCLEYAYKQLAKK